MTKKICNVAGCERKHYCRGMCIMHYLRWRRHGYPGKPKPLIERHGLEGTKIYRVWGNMKTRCLNPRNSAYKNYGGRGIEICEEWRDSFIAFYHDMGAPPTSKHQLDRIDNNQGYSPDNCRWVLPIENQRNRRNTRLTIEQAREIRELHKKGISRREIVQRFNSRLWLVKHVLSDQAWADS